MKNRSKTRSRRRRELNFVKEYTSVLKVEKELEPNVETGRHKYKEVEDIPKTVSALSNLTHLLTKMIRKSLV